MKNIADKLIKIMDDCSYVQKKGTNTFHKYNYATASDVLEKVSKACVVHGVATFANSEILSWTPVEKNTDKGIKTEFYATVKVTMTLIDRDSGESLTFSGVGCGQDAGDKAVMKAETAASKYAWMMSLNIATGDDPEADSEADRRNHEEQKMLIIPSGNPQHQCTDCGKSISVQVMKFSMNNPKMKRPLCTTCQAKIKVGA